MKAVIFKKYGGSDVLEVDGVTEKPTPKEGQVLVEVHAASTNPIDWKIREGYLKDNMPLNFPVTIGGDFAGVVAELGPGVSNFKVGDEVYGQGGVYNGGSGSFAEFTTAAVLKLAIKPKNADFVEAAALPLAGVSALQAIFDHIELSADQKILIHGGAGGIGHLAVQIAKSIGAYVATTVSSDDFEFVKSLGADEAIDYKGEDFSTKLSDFDAVFDTVGGDVTNKSFEVLKSGGILVSMVGAPSEDLAKKYGVVAIGESTDSNPDRLARLTKLVEDEKIKVNVDKVFPIEQAKEAFDHSEAGHPRGKVVVKVSE